MSNEATPRIGGASNDRAAKDDAVFTVSVAAQLVGMHAQTLRQYDRLGLVSPSRTKGRGRRYSRGDVQRLREVQRMTQEGVNLAGVQLAIKLQNRVDALVREVEELNEALKSASSPTPRPRVFAANSRGHVTLRAPGIARGNSSRLVYSGSERPRTNPDDSPGIDSNPGNALVSRGSLTGWQRLVSLHLERLYRDRLRPSEAE